MSVDELLKKINHIIGSKRYQIYDCKKHKKFKLVIPFYYQVYIRDLKYGSSFYLSRDLPIINYKYDVRPLTESEIYTREIRYGLTKEQIRVELFKLKNGQEGYYLIDLKQRKYWYFQTRKALDDQLLEWKIGVLVPIVEFQQN